MNRNSRSAHLATLIAADAIALWVAVRLVPGIRFPAAETFPSGEWWKLAAAAVLFGVLGAYLKPMLKAISLPARLATLGLFSWVINAALLLLLAGLADALSLGLRVGGFPPRLDVPAVEAALLGSLVISVVSLVVSDLIPTRSGWASGLGR